MTDSNDLLKIDTPENVTFDYDIAGIGSRFLAALIDTALIVIVQVILFGGVILVISLPQVEMTGAVASWLFAIAGLVSFVFLWGYYIFFEILWNGQTPGKRQIGLRVIRVDGTPVSASEVIIRNLVRIIDFLPSAYGIGVVTMFINPNSRRVGDLAAGTIVVHDRAVKNLSDLSPVRPSSLAVPGAQAYLPEGFPVEQVSEHELHIIEEFLSRRKSLSNSSKLAHHILTSIVTRLGLPADSVPFAHSEFILAEIYSARRSGASE
ncbi:MAG: RDD family protein [Chloroflexi bacterium]|nr:RDD family protein [Chloroflexota bacterium]MDL1942810.1 RDD family protein [Chloroflexi bacterium CFX2]